VGDVEDLALATEVVDTLYNRAVVASIGPIAATYSTDVLAAGAAPSRLAAQSAALGSAAADAVPFELTVSRQPQDHVKGLVADRQVQAFAAVLRAREEESWVQRLDRIRKAAPGKERHREVSRHAAGLAEVLVGVADVRMDTALRVRLHLLGTASSSASAAVIEATGAFNPLLGGVFGVLASGYAEGRNALSGHRAVAGARRALGQMVGPTA
jgi:hypothetical protein